MQTDLEKSESKTEMEGHQKHEATNLGATGSATVFPICSVQLVQKVRIWPEQLPRLKLLTPKGGEVKACCSCLVHLNRSMGTEDHDQVAAVLEHETLERCDG